MIFYNFAVSDYGGSDIKQADVPCKFRRRCTDSYLVRAHPAEDPYFPVRNPQRDWRKPFHSSAASASHYHYINVIFRVLTYSPFSVATRTRSARQPPLGVAFIVLSHVPCLMW